MRDPIAALSKVLSQSFGARPAEATIPLSSFTEYLGSVLPKATGDAILKLCQPAIVELCESSIVGFQQKSFQKELNEDNFCAAANRLRGTTSKFPADTVQFLMPEAQKAYHTLTAMADVLDLIGKIQTNTPPPNDPLIFQKEIALAIPYVSNADLNKAAVIARHFQRELKSWTTKINDSDPVWGGRLKAEAASILSEYTTALSGRCDADSVLGFMQAVKRLYEDKTEQAKRLQLTGSSDWKEQLQNTSLWLGVENNLIAEAMRLATPRKHEPDQVIRTTIRQSEINAQTQAAQSRTQFGGR